MLLRISEQILRYSLDEQNWIKSFQWKHCWCWYREQSGVRGVPSGAGVLLLLHVHFFSIICKWSLNMQVKITLLTYFVNSQSCAVDFNCVIWWYDQGCTVDFNCVIWRLNSTNFPVSCATLYLKRDHSFSTYAKLSEKLTFLTPWNAHLR